MEPGDEFIVSDHGLIGPNGWFQWCTYFHMSPESLRKPTSANDHDSMDRLVLTVRIEYTST